MITLPNQLKIIAVSIVTSFFIASSNSTSSDHVFPSRHEAGETTSVSIHHGPYQTQFSLGDPLEFHGIALGVTSSDAEEPTIIDEGYEIIAGDSMKLGSQDITVTYDGKSTSFAIDITNEEAIVNPLEATGIFISEILSDDEGRQALELYNGTYSSIPWGTFELRLQQGDSIETITLPLVENQDEIFLIANAADEVYGSVPSLIVPTLDLSSLDNITLWDTSNDEALEVIDFSLSQTELIASNGLVTNDAYHLSRSGKVIMPSQTTDWLDWRLMDDPSTIGAHTLENPKITPEQQATSYAEYVMYGVGMNAAGNHVNVFEELRAEYGFMDSDSKVYLIQHKNHAISGINEVGRLVTNSYNDAIGRYNYLAGLSGNPGLTSSGSTINVDKDTMTNIIVFGSIILLASAFYVFIRLRTRR